MNTITIPRILLPKVADMSAWAVIACDQFTSDGEYWRNLKAFVGDKPSALNLIYPEIFLGHNAEERIGRINETMYSYLEDGLFAPVDGLVLVERTTQSGTRTGIMLAIDLEDYSFERGALTPVRSTEETIAERIPPRVQIRENAPIELPHIMLLYDDPQNAVLSVVERGEVLYDFDLNMGGGHVKGTRITDPEEVIPAFYSLADPCGCRLGGNCPARLLFVVGDGNHSLAAAKTRWENVTQGLTLAERESHPARFALVEAVNIHDKALNFEPIHRFVKTDSPDRFIKGLQAIGGEGKATVFVGGKRGAVHIPAEVPSAIRVLDEYIASFIAENGGEVDYIHGDEQLLSLSSCGVGVKLPAIDRSLLFGYVAEDGNLPRKTFSLGEANEKRYYVEAKAIK